MKTTALVIMAAGIGSRFGKGIKQLEPIDGNGHIIVDYSIHDAIEAGFNRIVFVIRKDIEEDFKEIIGNRIEKVCNDHNVSVNYCFQSKENIPGTVPEGRTKPWGTGQAVLAAKELISSPFAVINADDYYGKEAFREMHSWLSEDHADNAIAMAGFILRNTLSENGGVTRGVCYVDEGHSHITNIVETKNIIKTPTGPMADGKALDPDGYVSMNFWGFPAPDGRQPAFIGTLENGFAEFFDKAVPADPLKAEYLLPTLIGSLLRNGDVTVKVLPTQDHWFGVTYQEDKAAVMESFRKLIEDGVYTKDLY